MRKAYISNLHCRPVFFSSIACLLCVVSNATLTHMRAQIVELCGMRHIIAIRESDQWNILIRGLKRLHSILRVQDALKAETLDGTVLASKLAHGCLTTCKLAMSEFYKASCTSTIGLQDFGRIRFDVCSNVKCLIFFDDVGSSCSRERAGGC
jgi:hypothetical protein